MMKKLAVALLLVVALAAKLSAQEPAPKAVPNAPKTHWHKYVNKEYGFSFSYPDTYRPSKDAAFCKDNDFRRYLLCLERRDDSETTIWVTIVTGAPFFIQTNRGDNEYTPQTIGHHRFYCGLGGSMGVGFWDECTFNLKGKALEFNFFPATTINSGETINRVMFKSLETFRTF
jgi:hypothetical protein